MAVGSGVGSFVGVAVESTYGTYVAPTKFLQVTKAPFKKVKNTVTPEWAGAGQLLAKGSGRVVTTKAGSGSIELDVWNKSMGIMLQSLMGTTATPQQQSATIAYLQTHTLADVVGKSFSCQVGLADTTGTQRPYSFLGCKVTDATFTVEVDKEVTAQFSVDARDVTEAQGLASPSFLTGTRPFVGTDNTIKAGTFGSEASVTGVKKVSVKIDRQLNTGRFYMGQNGLKAEPLVAGMAKITGTISADYVDKTLWADKFASDSPFSLVIEGIGLNIASTFFDTFRITLPQCFLDGDTPTLDGLDVVSGDFPFVCLYDGTNLPKIEYMSTDTSV